jgi:uncharacterized protein
MTPKNNIILKIQQNFEKIKQFGVKKIGLFGSFIYKYQNKKSDIDILVEFNKNKKTFDNYMELKFFLEEIFQRKIDLVIKGTLKSKIKKQVLEEVKYA